MYKVYVFTTYFHRKWVKSMKPKNRDMNVSWKQSMVNIHKASWVKTIIRKVIFISFCSAIYPLFENN